MLFPFEVCPPGKFLSGFNPDGSSICVQCPMGTWQDSENDDSTCVRCPENSTSMNNGSTSRQDCGEFMKYMDYAYPCIFTKGHLKNWTSRDTYLILDSWEVFFNLILVCMEGFYASGMVCLPCDKGFFNNQLNQTTCDPCPGNQTTTATTSTSHDQCGNFLCYLFVMWVVYLWETGS